MTGDTTQLVELANGGKVKVRLSITTDLNGHGALAAAKPIEVRELLAEYAAGARVPLQALADELSSRAGAITE